MIDSKDPLTNEEREEDEDDSTRVSIQNDWGCAIWIIAICVLLATCKYMGQ